MGNVSFGSFGRDVQFLSNSEVGLAVELRRETIEKLLTQ
jgi:hypothetical protein